MLIAQLSDPHIFGRGELMEGRIDTATHLSMALSTLTSFTRTPDVVLLTGDLVNDGTDDQYENLRDVLADKLKDVVVVAGNHDDRQGLRHLFPQLDHVGSGDECIDYVVDMNVEDFAASFIILDTTVPGEHAGSLSAEQLFWLETQIECRTERRIVVVQHHPPFASGIGFMDDYGLIGASEEADVLQRFNNVDAVLCGHLHRPASSFFGGTIAFASPSTAAQVSPSFNGETTSYTEEPGMFSLHLWDAAGLVTHVHPVGEPGRWVPAWAQ